jgi:hypothetical protein
VEGLAGGAEARGWARPGSGTGDQQAGWRKIFIMGPPGSGKTFWAQRLAAMTGLPCYELDRWFLLPEADSERVRWQVELLAQEEWIVEGIYPWPEAMRAADAVLVLTPPWWVRDFRIVWRRYLSPALVKLAAAVRGLVATLHTSHHYAGNHLTRSKSAAAAAGISLIVVPTGQHLVRHVLAHRTAGVSLLSSQAIPSAQGENVFGEALRAGVAVVGPPAGLARYQREGEE